MPNSHLRSDRGELGKTLLDQQPHDCHRPDQCVTPPSRTPSTPAESPVTPLSAQSSRRTLTWSSTRASNSHAANSDLHARQPQPLISHSTVLTVEPAHVISPPVARGRACCRGIVHLWHLAPKWFRALFIFAVLVGLFFLGAFLLMLLFPHFHAGLRALYGCHGVGLPRLFSPSGAVISQPLKDCAKVARKALQITDINSKEMPVPNIVHFIYGLAGEISHTYSMQQSVLLSLTACYVFLISMCVLGSDSSRRVQCDLSFEHCERFQLAATSPHLPAPQLYAARSMVGCDSEALWRCVTARARQPTEHDLRPAHLTLCAQGGRAASGSVAEARRHLPRLGRGSGAQCGSASNTAAGHGRRRSDEPAAEAAHRRAVAATSCMCLTGVSLSACCCALCFHHSQPSLPAF
jgi:hypothetical protein